MTYDLIIIGTGPGGYVCAIRAAQLGLKVAVVEKRKTHGGTCLNIGCIPSKALLQASEKFREAAHDLAGFGVITGMPELDLPAMMKHKDDTVAANVNGVGFLFKKNKIDAFIGQGTITAPGVVEVKAADGSKQKVEAKNIVIATGSDVVPLPGIEIDEQTIVSSTGALSLENRRGGRHWSRTWLGLEPPWRRGDRRRILGSHSSWHGRRSRQTVPAHAGETGISFSSRP
jgi:dihydrolipoamide dehydrogenase